MEYNLDKFLNNECNILFITGLAGSGKTTLANKMAKSNNIKCIHCDDIISYDFKKEFLKSNTYDKWDSYKLNYLLSIIKKYENKKIIVEGYRIITRIPDDMIKNNSIIILETSFWKSYFRAIKRCFTKIHINKYGFRLFYHLKFYFRINKKYLDRFNNFKNKINKYKESDVKL